MVYNIRSATIHDIDAICSLMRESVCELCKEFYTKPQLESYLKDFPKKVYYNDLISDRILIVACDQDKIVGFTQYDPSESALDAIYVLPGHTGNGLGSRMLRYIEDVARSLKKQEIQIGTSINAITFYEKSKYIFQRKFIQTCKDGTQFESARLKKSLSD